MRMKPCLTADDVHKMMAACKTHAETKNWKVAIAIVDEAGFGLLVERMDGVGPAAFAVAMGKAHTAALTRRPSKWMEERIKERPVFLKYPADVPIWGGLPITHQGECVGAIGVSGVQSHEDEEIAQAGIDALG